VLLVLVVFAGTLWAAAGIVSRRILWPLGELVRVANAIGSGDLQSRARFKRTRAGELGVLADAINEMAERIERQMGDQRELLAAVSHEIRSPLARLRVLSELIRERGVDPASLDELERELSEVDALVDELLAGSRLDFGAMSRSDLDARDVATRALVRAGLSEDLLLVRRGTTRFVGDATLLSRALTNLLNNAASHGGGATAVIVEGDAEELRFLVEDAGNGFLPELLDTAFDSFVRGQRGHGSSLGLGLALVRRIAEAHGGRAWAENRSEGGARVGFSVARAAAVGP
jgi:signal transduction histidine kinase